MRWGERLLGGPADDTHAAPPEPHAPVAGRANWRDGATARAAKVAIRLADLACRAVLVVVLIGELALILIEVTQRFAIQNSFLWSEEISRLALTTLAFLGGAVSYRAKHHTAIRFITASLPAAAREAIAAAVDLLILGVALTCVLVSFDLLSINGESVTPILQFNQAWLVVPFTAGMALIVVFALERLVFDHRGAAVLRAAPVILALGLGVVGFAYLPALRPGEGLALSMMLAVFFASVLLGLPVSFSMLLGSIFYLVLTDVTPLVAVAQNAIDGSGHFILLTLPFFIWAGMIMEQGGISLRLVRFAMALVGHVRGGLLQVVVVTTYLVSGVSGSKVADVVAVGSVMRKELERKGYKLENGAAVLSASAAMAETIPPSIAMLVLGSVVPISIGGMFVAGLLPAAVLAAFLMTAVYVLAARAPTPRVPRARAAELVAASLGAILPLIMPLILIVGIKFGIATPTEVSSVAVLYGILLSVLVYRSIGLAAFFRIAASCGVMAGMVLFIIASAGSFAWIMTAAGLPLYLVRLLHLAGDNKYLFLVGSVVILIIVGSLLEGLPALIILAPVLVPIASQLGIGGVHYAIVLLLAMGVGIFMPPIGIGFYISCSVMNSSVEATARAIVPYLMVLLIGIIVLAFVPWFTYVVPQMLG